MNASFISTKDLSSKITKVGDGAVTFNGEIVNIPSGKVTNYFWNNDGALVLEDEKGNKYFFVAKQKCYVAFKGQDTPYDAEGYRKALEKSRKEREMAENPKKHKKEDREKGGRKFRFSIWSIFKWLFKGAFNLFLMIGFLGNEKKN